MYLRKGLLEALAGIAAGLERRGEPVDVAAVTALCGERRQLQARVDELRREAKEAAARVQAADPKDREGLIAAARALGEECKAAETAERAAATTLDELLASWPNLPLPEVPDGAEGKVVKTWGEPPTAAAPAHDDIAADLGLANAQAAAAISGSGWPCLVGAGAALARHLGQWMLEEHLAAGFTEVAVPLAVGEAAMFNSGQLPKFADQTYRLERDGLWLIPTSEVPLVNYLACREWSEEELPRRVVALTPNFRREAGSHGAAVRGLLRQHQFEKVELVVAAAPGAGRAEAESLVSRAEGVLERLGLPYRRVLLGAADMAFSASLTFDLEIPMPHDGGWMEISSVSLCGEFQARRAGVRWRPAGGKPGYVELLNGTGVAVGRLVAALLEHGWEDGRVRLPDALAARMGTEVLQ